MIRSQLLAIGALFLLLLGSSCSDETSGVQGARSQVKWGNLEAAEELLEGESGPRAEEVRRLIASRRKSRADLAEEIERLMALEPTEALERLKALRLAEEDPGAEKQLKIAVSRAQDRAAEALASRRHTPMHPLGYRRDQLEEPLVGGDPWTVRRGDRDGSTRDDPSPRQVRAGMETLDTCRAEIQSAIEEKDWLRAWSEVQMALAVSGTRADEFRSLSDQVLALAQGEMVELMDRAEELDDEGRLGAAHAHLASAARRFPHLSGLAELRDSIDDYQGRLEIIAAAEAPPEETPRVVSPPVVVRTEERVEDPVEPGEGQPFQRALALERDGDLQAAMDAWLEAGFAALPGAERDTYIARATAIERRLQLRAEIVAAFELDPEGFEAELGITAVNAREVKLIAAGTLSWSSLTLDTLKRLASRVVLSSDAELGLIDERLSRGDHGGRGGALAKLAELVECGTLRQDEAWALIARTRGEGVPEKGYAFHRGRWVRQGDLDDAELAAAVAALERKLVKSDAEERDALLTALEELGPTSAPAIEKALTTRWKRALKTIQKGSVLSSLERLAAEREELDTRREVALELIFDEEEYFYPYRPPECPPQKARLYWPVQQRVDELVAATREVWLGSRTTRLSGGFRAALDELAWTLEMSSTHDFDVELPDEIPDWIWALPTEVEEVTLRHFAWTQKEREELRHDRAVLAFNRTRWDDAGSFDEAQSPGNEEQRQVRITNEYRMLFGRRALAWNPKIQEAARGHSDYMAATGHFGHFEEGDPERRTPFDRMRLVEYNHGVSENCHMGSGSPEGAHNGWVHSSGHHRNILMPGHREMASGLTSGYWTQNFGVGTDFETDLEPWQD